MRGVGFLGEVGCGCWKIGVLGGITYVVGGSGLDRSIGKVVAKWYCWGVCGMRNGVELGGCLR